MMILYDDSTRLQSAKEKKNRRREGSKFVKKFDVVHRTVFIITRFIGIKMKIEENVPFVESWMSGNFIGILVCGLA